MFLTRGSGILLHITSLPGRFGVGDLGPAAEAFVDFLVDSGQQYWQFLPLCPTSRGLDNSPYMGLSAFAGNPLLISPELLADDGLVSRRRLENVPAFSEYLVDFDQVIPWKEALLAEAFAEFKAGGGLEHQDFRRFCAASPWLDDYALFVSLREENSLKAWYDWPAPLAGRQPEALAAARKRLVDRIDFRCFVQFTFDRQWQRLRRRAADRRVRLIGDIPIYVAPDSADLWTNQECFELDPQTRQPTHVAGVPPDYFSATGQRWGNPLFRWEARERPVRERLYEWWGCRFQHVFSLVDIVRIDHFRGFESFWRIPATEPDAVQGEWGKGPGRAFFQEMAAAIGELPIIAEDLGIITPAVEELRDSLGFPGMKVLQFAFDSDQTNAYLPCNYPTPNCVVYTGTHDNDTTVGWYFSDKVTPAARERLMRYAHSREGSPVHWDLIRLGMASVAAVVIIPLQDVLGFGSDCRMNLPSTCQDNWRWRVAPRFLTGPLAVRLRDETVFYNRDPREEEN